MELGNNSRLEMDFATLTKEQFAAILRENEMLRNATAEKLSEKEEQLSLEELKQLIAQKEQEISNYKHENTAYKKEVGAYQKEVGAYQKEVGAYQKEVSDYENLVLRLRGQVEKLARMLMGQKRERFVAPDVVALENLFSSVDVEIPPIIVQELERKAEELKQQEETEKQKEKKSNHKGRNPLPSHLEVREEVILPEGDLSDLVYLGDEVTETLECEPAKLYIRRIIRKKYVSKEGSFKIAPLPELAFDRVIAGVTLITQILIDKYIDHLPLYRIRKRFARDKIDIPDSTIGGWVRQSLDRLEILYDCMVALVKINAYLQVDETTLKVLDRTIKGKTHLGYYWAYNSPIDNCIFFEYHPSRAGSVVNETLADFKGYIQTDGYKGYDKLGKKDGNTHLSCWAHARRKFDEALKSDKQKATIALTFIQGLYAVEATAREQKLDPAARKELRLEKSLPIYNAFGEWLNKEVNNLKTNAGLIADAFRYTINLWPQLSNYMLDGHLEIDNNLIENAIRPIALGRKNYMFGGSHDAAKRGAIIYTFFAMCERHQVDPREWLEYVLTNIQSTKTSQLHTLLPQNYKKLVL
jgi:transposase